MSDVIIAIIILIVPILLIVVIPNRTLSKFIKEESELDMIVDRQYEQIRKRRENSAQGERVWFYNVLIKGMLGYVNAIKIEIDNVEKEGENSNIPNAISNGLMLRFYVLERELKERMRKHLILIGGYDHIKFVEMQNDYDRYKKELECIVKEMGLEERVDSFYKHVEKNIGEHKEGYDD